MAIWFCWLNEADEGGLVMLVFALWKLAAPVPGEKRKGVSETEEGECDSGVLRPDGMWFVGLWI
jgi:hypothetical protein